MAGIACCIFLVTFLRQSAKKQQEFLCILLQAKAVAPTMESLPLLHLPPALDALIVASTGNEPRDLAPTFGGFSNLTVSATLAGQRCIIKAATVPAKRAGIRREAALLEALRGSGLPVPVLLTFAEDATWTVAVMLELPGVNGLRVLANAPAALPDVFAALGMALGYVHGTPPPALAHFLFVERCANARVTLGNANIPHAVRDALMDSLDHPAWHTMPVGFVHGDIGLHNLLWDGAQLALLDWEWAGAGPVALDLAWLQWTMHWRSLDDTLWSIFCAAYTATGKGNTLPTSEAAHALALGQIALILAQTEGAAFAEWLGRAQWAIERNE